MKCSYPVCSGRSFYRRACLEILGRFSRFLLCVAIQQNERSLFVRRAAGRKVESIQADMRALMDAVTSLSGEANASAEPLRQVR